MDIRRHRHVINLVLKGPSPRNQTSFISSRRVLTALFSQVAQDKILNLGSAPLSSLVKRLFVCLIYVAGARVIQSPP